MSMYLRVRASLGCVPNACMHVYTCISTCMPLYIDVCMHLAQYARGIVWDSCEHGLASWWVARGTEAKIRGCFFPKGRERERERERERLWEYAGMPAYLCTRQEIVNGKTCWQQRCILKETWFGKTCCQKSCRCLCTLKEPLDGTRIPAKYTLNEAWLLAYAMLLFTDAEFLVPRIWPSTCSQRC